VQRVVVDANVFISYLTGRHEKQYDAASSLLQEAEDGHLVAVLPQFVVFEVTYVLQSLYNVNGGRLASMVSALVFFPGVHIVDDCPWKRVLEIWPETVPGLADAADRRRRRREPVRCGSDLRPKALQPPRSVWPRRVLVASQ